MNKTLAVLLVAVLGWGGAVAQGAAPASAVAPAPPPAIQSPSIHDVKPDASSEPGYAKQSNAERAQVQPGNNAPMWRQVGSGVSGYSSLPTPEAGNLVQPIVKVPGLRASSAGEVWRQVRNQWIIPYGGALLLIILGAIGVFYWRTGSLALHGAPTGRKIERFTPFERAAHCRQRHGLCRSGAVRHRHGVWQVLHPAGDRHRAVWLADLCAQDRAQLCRSGVCGVLGCGDRHLHQGQPAALGRFHLVAARRRLAQPA